MDRVDMVLEGLWHFLTSMRVAMVLILVLAVLGVIGSLVIQAPPGVLTDPAAKADWLNEIRPRFGGLTGLMDSLQLFQIFNSVMFRIIVAALTISLIACSIHRIPGMVRTAVKPRVDVGSGFFEHAPQHETIVVRHSPAETLAIVQGLLNNKHYRTIATDDGTLHLYADRFRWAPFAGLIGHLSLVVILAGAIVGSTFGYRDSGFTIAEGATLPVAAEDGLSIQLIDFTDTYYVATGAPEDYASEVVLYKDGTEVARHTIRVNDPLRYGDTSFYQAFFGTAAVMTVKDDTGTTLVSEGVPLAWRTTADDRPIGSFSIPGSPYVGWVIGTLGSGDPKVKPGQMELDLYTADTGTQVDTVVLDQGDACDRRRAHRDLRSRKPVHRPQRGARSRRHAGVAGGAAAVRRLRDPVHDPAQARVGEDHRPRQRRGRSGAGEPGQPGDNAGNRVRKPCDYRPPGAPGAGAKLRETWPWPRCPNTPSWRRC